LEIGDRWARRAVSALNTSAFDLDPRMRDRVGGADDLEKNSVNTKKLTMR
jgi:hypothetical protein